MSSHLCKDMIAAWREASDELGVRFEGPYQTASGEIVEGYLPDFGGPAGMVVVDIDRVPATGTGAVRWSGLGEGYRSYQRQLFVDTLNDWGFFGPEAGRPPWFIGAPWS